MALLSLHSVTLGFGGHPILENATLQIEPAERVALIGRNGAGKSTLMKVISEEMEIESGEIRKKPGLRVARLIQEVPLDIQGSVFCVVAGGLGKAGEVLGEYQDISEKLADDPVLYSRFEKLQQRLTEDDLWSLQTQIDKTISRLSLDPAAEVSTLSSGMKRRVLFARSIVRDPDLLLLDEPTNHMDIDAITELEDMLLRFAGTLLFVTHDRAFLQRVATRILDLDRGKLSSWDCRYHEYLERKQAYLEAEAQQFAKFDKKLAQEETWIRKGIKARRVRNEGRVKDLKKLRDQRADRRDVVGQVKMQIQHADKSGKLVAKATNLCFSHGDNTIVQNFSTMIMRGDRVGFVGPNGVGKTTLLRLLLGQLTPDSGVIKLGTQFQVAYFDQLREQLDEERTVADNVADGSDHVTINGVKKHILGYLQEFLFTPERARRPLLSLSGGERNRLLLAKLFTRPSNVLVLDEPTNDLDAETLELLEDLLQSYDGTVLLVSHDRAFLNNVVTSTMVFEAPGQVKEYVGGYDDWLRQRPAPKVEKAEKKGKAQSKPSRKKKKKLSFHLVKELAALPERIETMEARQAELYHEMAQADFFKQSEATIVEKKEELATLKADLATTYERWDSLESMNE
jgi:ABC transport system ATP-binding/permease protein